MADSVSQVVRSVLAKLTGAWRTGSTHEIGPLLHPSVVFVRPGFAGRAEGQTACIATYDEFLKVALVLRYEESEVTVDVFGDTAVASLRWEMAWEIGGQRSEEAGYDVYVLVAVQGKWLVAWRTLFPTPL
jgi:hypothetical protein